MLSLQPDNVESHTRAQLKSHMSRKPAKWTTIETNDDSADMPAQPSGSKYNSQMRISSDTSNPAKAIVTGLHRIGFTTYKTGKVQGSFLAQIGSPVKLPGVAVCANPLDLMAAPEPLFLFSGF
jgi:hypothetical protein